MSSHGPEVRAFCCPCTPVSINQLIFIQTLVQSFGGHSHDVDEFSTQHAWRTGHACAGGPQLIAKAANIRRSAATSALLGVWHDCKWDEQLRFACSSIWTVLMLSYCSISQVIGQLWLWPIYVVIATQSLLFAVLLLT